MRTGRIASTAIVAMIVCALVGCVRRPEKVHFILPDGFRGAFAIKPDDLDGIELKKTGGRYVITIPESGVLKIKGHDPFRSYLNTASFASGEPIWVRKRTDDKPGSGEVALWDTDTEAWSEGGQPVNYFWWFVSTEEEWKAADNDVRHRPGGVVEKESK